MINDLKARFTSGKKSSEEDELDELDEEISTEDNSSRHDRTDITDTTAADEEVEEDSSLVSKLKSKIKTIQKSPNGKVGSGGGKSSKNLRANIIRGVIVLGLIAFAAEEYIFPPEEVAQPSVEVPRKKPVPREQEGAPKDEAPSAELPQVTNQPPEESTSTETPSEVPSTVSETPIDSSVDVTSTEVPLDALPSESVVEPIPSESVPSEVIPPAGEVTSGETNEGDSGVPTEDNLTDQILQDLEKQAGKSEPSEPKKEYVAPPDYEYLGRGLVYNCVGKHWACVDGPSYKLCEDNSSSTKFLGKQIECYPFNVYESQRGCETMQRRMVTSSAKTNFCQDN